MNEKGDSVRMDRAVKEERSGEGWLRGSERESGSELIDLREPSEWGGLGRPGRLQTFSVLYGLQRSKPSEITGQNMLPHFTDLDSCFGNRVVLRHVQRTAALEDSQCLSL